LIVEDITSNAFILAYYWDDKIQDGVDTEVIDEIHLQNFSGEHRVKMHHCTSRFVSEVPEFIEICWSNASGNGIYMNVIQQFAFNMEAWSKCTERPRVRMRLPREPKSRCDRVKSLTTHVTVLLTANYHPDRRPNWIMKWLIHYVTAH
jgi:hypothetical protein